MHRLIFSVIRQRKRPEVRCDTYPGAESLVRIYGLPWRTMHFAHEPLRPKSSDGQDGKPDIGKALGDEMEVRAEAGVGGEVDGAACSEVRRWHQHEPAPQRGVAVERSASGEVLCRYADQLHSSVQLNLIPPIHLMCAPITELLEATAVAEPGIKLRIVFAPELPERPDIHVVVMVVTEQHSVNLRQILKTNSRRTYPCRSHPLQRARSSRPYRIRQDVQPEHLEKKCRVVHERDSQRVRRLVRLRYSLGRLGPRLRVAPLRPLAALT